MLRNQQDLWCCLGTHCPLPAIPQGPAEHVVSSWDPVVPAFRFSGTRRTYGDLSGRTAPCLPLLSDRQDLWCRHGTYWPLTASALGSAAPAVSFWDSLPTACRRSGTRWTCGVVSGPTGPCLPLLRNLKDLWCHLEPHYSLPASVQGTSRPVSSSRESVFIMSLLRDPQYLWCSLGNNCPLPAAAQ